MQNKEITISTYSHAEIEANIINMEAEVNDFSALQAKEDSQKEFLLSEAIYKIKFLEPLQSLVQPCIDSIRQTLHPASRFHDVNEAEAIANKQIQVINNEANDKRHKRMSLFRKQNAIQPDSLKLKSGRWFLPVSLLFGLVDGCVAYTNFRNGSYTPTLAFFTALAIALAISFSHYGYTNWITKAKVERQRTMRIILILSIAFIFFLLISNLRAGAANNTVDISIDNSTISAPASSNISGLPIALASFALFTLVLFLALRFWMSKKERLEAEEYSRLGKGIEKLDEEIASMEKEKKQIEQSILQQRSEARKIFDYALNSIRRCKNIALNGVSTYKRVYARFRNDEVPDFFAAPCDLVFDETFHFSNVQKTEPV
jgi:hypothetical protein